MLSMDDSLAELVDRALVDFEIAYPYFTDTEKRAAVQRRVYRTAPVRGARLMGDRPSGSPRAASARS